MNGLRTKAYRTIYFWLITAGAASWVGYLIMDDPRAAILGYAAAILCALPISLIPASVGTARSFPLRVPIAGLCAAGVIAACAMAGPTIGSSMLRGTFWGLLLGALFFFAVREACMAYPQWTGTHGSIAGIVLYIVPAIFLTFSEAPEMKTFTWIAAVVFLGVTGFSLNSQNVLTGLAARTNIRPPQSLRGGNRMLMACFTGIVLIVVFIGQLRVFFTRLGNLILRGIFYLLYLIASLRGDSTAPTGESTGGDMSGMLAGLEPGEESTFWAAAEKVMVVVAILIGIVLVLFALRYLGKLVVRLIRRLREYLKQFGQDASAEYVDEQEGLFDMDDLRENLQNRLEGIRNRFARRQKRWEDMTVRERVRYCIRSVYRRAGDSVSGVEAMTFREAAPHLGRGGVHPEEFADLYEQARYSDEEPEAAAAEALRKAVHS